MGGELVVLVTTPSGAEAEKIATRLVERHLAACVNILPRITSFFWWEERLQREEEALLMIKTTASRFEELAREVKALHSYSVPEVIAIPITHGTESYLAWLRETTQ